MQEAAPGPASPVFHALARLNTPIDHLDREPENPERFGGVCVNKKVTPSIHLLLSVCYMYIHHIMINGCPIPRSFLARIEGVTLDIVTYSHGQLHISIHFTVPIVELLSTEYGLFKHP